MDKQQLIEKLSRENGERIQQLSKLHDLMRQYKREHWLSYHLEKLIGFITNSQTLIGHEYDIHCLYYEANNASRMIGQLQQQINIEEMLAGSVSTPRPIPSPPNPPDTPARARY